MTSQTTVAALRSLDLAEFVVMSTRTQRPSVSTELGEVYRQNLPEDKRDVPLPDWDAIQETNAALLEGSTRTVRHADQTHRLNQVTWSRMRGDRRKLIAGLRDQHRGLRKAFAGIYGKTSLPLVGLDAPPEIRMVAVREQALELLERLRNPRLASQLPEPRAGFTPLDLDALADAIEAKIRELEALLEEMQRMRKTLDASLVAKRQALETHARFYLNVARIQEAYYRIAGLDDLARRIRTAFRPSFFRKAEKKADDEAQKTRSEEKTSDSSPEDQDPDEPPASTELAAVA